MFEVPSTLSGAIPKPLLLQMLPYFYGVIMNNVEIYLSKRNKIVIEPTQSIIDSLNGLKQEAVLEQEFEKAALIREKVDLLNNKVSLATIATFQKNLESLGYILHPTVVEALRTTSAKEANRVFSKVIPILQEFVGVGKNWTPFYPNFPQQVMEASEAELYLNACLHYFSVFVSDVTGNNFIWIPAYDKKTRSKLEQDVKLKVIQLGTEEDFNEIFTTLCSANSSISESDKEILKWFIENNKNSVSLLPDEIPQKEILSFATAQYLKNGISIVSRLKTATDVLRTAVSYCDGDVSLAKPTKFTKINRATRRLFLTSLEQISQITEDMLRYPEQWKRLGKELHPGEYKNKFPKTYAAFDIIRNKLPFDTFNSAVEKSLRNQKFSTAIDLLKTRPGMFARRLDHLLRQPNLGDNFEMAMEQFSLCSADVSTPVLVQAYHHFAYREKETQRVFFPKGQVSKLQLLEEKLPELDDSHLIAKHIRQVLFNRFAKMPSLGKCYVDENLRTQMVPFALRSASKALKTIARGSRISLSDSNTIRFFLWWKNLEVEGGNKKYVSSWHRPGRVDIDLSAVFIGTDYSNKGQVSYYDLRNKNYGCHHSGDITDAPNGACEFIDLNRDKLLSQNVGYVAMCLNSFTSEPFCDLPECFAGWMERSAPDSGEVFEAKTVQNKIDLSADSTVAIPVIVDLVNRQVIWTDLALTSFAWINNVRSNEQNITKMVKAMVNLNRPNLYDLFSLHVSARGIPVSESEAETKFSLDEGITPFDTDRILSEFLK